MKVNKALSTRDATRKTGFAPVQSDQTALACSRLPRRRHNILWAYSLVQIFSCADCAQGRFALLPCACDIFCRRANSDLTYWAMLSSSDFNCSSSVLPLDPFFSCSISRRILCRIFLASLDVQALLAYSDFGAHA